MIICHCNTIAPEAFEDTLARHFAEVSEKHTLKQAVGLVWRKTVDDNRSHRNPFSCSICFDEVAKMIQAQGLFEGQAIPDMRRNCQDCPRMAECGLFTPVNK